MNQEQQEEMTRECIEFAKLAVEQEPKLLEFIKQYQAIVSVLEMGLDKWTGKLVELIPEYGDETKPYTELVFKNLKTRAPEAAKIIGRIFEVKAMEAQKKAMEARKGLIVPGDNGFPGSVNPGMLN